MRVSLATKEGCPDLDSDKVYYGLTYKEAHDVIISAHFSEYMQDVTLLHELGHIACVGIDVSFAKEEAVLNHADKELWGMLRSLGFKWPRRPAGYRALRKKARGMR